MVILVLGMHRSGTSLMANLLHHMGVDMGPNNDIKAPDNPRGYYEDMAFVRTNDYILKLAGGSWYNPPTTDNIRQAGETPLMQRHIRSLLNAKSNGASWGWKDPRTVLTGAIYLQFLENPYLICTHRNPLAVASSLFKRNSMPIEHGLWLTVTYESMLIGLLIKYRHIRRIHVSYEALLRDEDQVKRIGDFLGLPVTDNVYEIIDRSLRHNV
ncbi:MAG: sulfotransferase [Thermodesulfobacteriota bacterium]|nr:sulfotransferase [Thermodesulfobacteriota bacterium]